MVIMDEEIERIVFVTHPMWPAVVPRYPAQNSKKPLNSSVRNGVAVNLPQEGELENRQRQTPKAVADFLYNNLIPLIRRIKGNFRVIVIRTPAFHMAGNGISKNFFADSAERLGFGDYNLLEGKDLRRFYKIIEPKLQTFFRVGPRAQRRADAIESKFFDALSKEFAGRVLYAHGTHGLTPRGIAKETQEYFRKNNMCLSKKAVVVGMGAWAEYCAKNYSREFARLQKIRHTVSMRGSISIKKCVRPKKFRKVRV
jgi:hypothetical protein